MLNKHRNYKYFTPPPSNPPRVHLMNIILKAGRCHKGFAIIYIRSVTCIISLEQAFMTSTGAICHVIVIIVIILIV